MIEYKNTEDFIIGQLRQFYHNWLKDIPSQYTEENVIERVKENPVYPDINSDDIKIALRNHIISELEN